jgi:hypothetical protein
MINIIPSQFAKTDDSFGGHVSGDSGIYTDIPAGVSIFRELAPFVGSRVLVKYDQNGFSPLPVNYSPQIGDQLEIIARRPENPLRQINFENQTGGSVTATFADGSSTVVTHVAKPVEGIGRFDGCSYTGTGAINTNHTCVITISTAPISTSTLLEGSGEERRGGFQIVPSYHNTQTEEAGSPQTMILGTPKSQVPEIEGTPPLFFGYIGLAYDPADLEHSWRCQIRKSDSSVWEEMPVMIGNDPQCIKKLGIAEFRILHNSGCEDLSWLDHRIDLCEKAFESRRELAAISGSEAIVRGTARIIPKSLAPNLHVEVAYVQYFIENRLVGITNTSPYEWSWNTSSISDGEYAIDTKLYTTDGSMISADRSLYWVDNSQKLAALLSGKKISRALPSNRPIR